MTDRSAPPTASDFPKSLFALESRFPTEEACATYLHELRWPDGFVCPRCGSRKGWPLSTKRHMIQCGGCRKQTSVTAGTLLHRSKLPLKTWFWAAWLMAAHSNGISAVQLQSLLGLGSYKTAWLLQAKLRRAMVDPERNPLAGVVEIDEGSMRYRTKDDPVDGGRGRSMTGKLAFAAAVETSESGAIQRIRLAPIADYSATALGDFIGAVVAQGAALRTDGWPAYAAIEGYDHTPTIVGPMAAHVLLEPVHTVISNLKIWAVGVYHGLRPKHIATYLDEFAFRFNRRRNRTAGVKSLLRLGINAKPKPYRQIKAADSGG